MTFRQALFLYVQGLTITNIPDFSDKFFYITAIGVESPYYIMRIISDLGQPQVLCDEQGSNGELLVQIDAIAEGSVQSDLLIEELYQEFLKIGGQISITDNLITYTYIIDDNRVEKPRPLNDGLDLGLQRWFFESKLKWRRIS